MKFRRLAKRAVTHPYLALALRLYVGGLFVYASMVKINHAAEFAETVASYQMVPYWGVNLMAVVLPWVELISGFLLVVGYRGKSAAAVIGFLLLIFTAGIALNLLRDAPISCGCFSALGEKMSWQTLARDLVWLGMTVQVLCCDRILHVENRFALALEKARR